MAVTKQEVFVAGTRKFDTLEAAVSHDRYLRIYALFPKREINYGGIRLEFSDAILALSDDPKLSQKIVEIMKEKIDVDSNG